MIGGYEECKNFHTDGLWIKFGVIPVANTLSGTFRVISSVALLAFNVLKVLALPVIALGEWMFSVESERFEEIKDSMKAIFFNATCIIGGTFEAIPIVGNIPYWILAATIGVSFDMKFEH